MVLSCIVKENDRPSPHMNEILFRNPKQSISKLGQPIEKWDSIAERVRLTPRIHE
jgi:hypothetical protein